MAGVAVFRAFAVSDFEYAVALAYDERCMTFVANIVADLVNKEILRFIHVSVSLRNEEAEHNWGVLRDGLPPGCFAPEAVETKVTERVPIGIGGEEFSFLRVLVGFHRRSS